MFIFLLVACGVDQDNFAEKFGEISCDQGLECELDGYDQYADADECVPQAAADWLAVAELGDEFDCSLDYEFAADCLKIFKKSDCDAVADRSWESEGECAELFACVTE